MLRTAALLAAAGLAGVAIGTTGGVGLAAQDDEQLDALFAGLRASEDPREAARLEDAIWAIWLESGDETVDRSMAAGMRSMSRGDHRRALAAFDAVVQVAPRFAEGWNKRATLYWLMGDYEASVADIDRTLALEPRHFGALSGLAMIRETQGRPFEALEALERVMRIHPRLPNLGERIDRLSRQLGEAI